MLCLLGRSLPGEAQQARSVSRVGVLLAGAPGAHVEAVEVFRQGLRELGWSEGQNLVLDLRYADNNYDRLSDLAADLVALKPDAIFAAAAPAIRAATQATTTIPIVSETLGDAVSAALASSLSHPGSNVTGISGFAPELNAKRLELIRELVPGATRIAVLVNLANPVTQPLVRVMETRTATERLMLRGAEG